MTTLFAIMALAAVHLGAGTTASLRRQWRPRALSAAAGISVCYVFLELLPDLTARQAVIDTGGFLPDLKHHVYILTSAYGVLLLALGPSG